MSEGRKENQFIRRESEPETYVKDPEVAQGMANIEHNLAKGELYYQVGERKLITDKPMDHVEKKKKVTVPNLKKVSKYSTAWFFADDVPHMEKFAEHQAEEYQKQMTERKQRIEQVEKLIKYFNFKKFDYYPTGLSYYEVDLIIDNEVITIKLSSKNGKYELENYSLNETNPIYDANGNLLELKGKLLDLLYDYIIDQIEKKINSIEKNKRTQDMEGKN